MRSFLWSCFEATGSIEAYLLYKDIGMIEKKKNQVEDLEEEEEEKKI